MRSIGVLPPYAAGLILPHHMTWFEMLQRECDIFGKNVFDFDTPPPEEVTANGREYAEGNNEDSTKGMGGADHERLLIVYQYTRTHVPHSAP